MKVCELIIGGFIVAIVLFDVFQSVVVPRQTARTLRVAPFLARRFWLVWRQIGHYLRLLKQREYFLGIFAPLALILELLVWVISLIFGYGLMLHALHSQLRPMTNDFGSALYLAGASLFTLGFDNVVPIGITRVIVLAAAASGVAVMSLTITLLFSLYSSFQRREVLVVLLDTRAGTPPSGLTLLETYTQLGLHSGYLSSNRNNSTPTPDVNAHVASSTTSPVAAPTLPSPTNPVAIPPPPPTKSATAAEVKRNS